MSDSASLTCNAAACNSANNVELLNIISKSERLTNDELECFETEILVDASAVYSNIT